MNFRKVKLDLQEWLTINHLAKPGIQILEGKNLSQDIHMLSIWGKDWNEKPTLVCYSNDLAEEEFTENLKEYVGLPVTYNREFHECRLVVIGHLGTQ
ncbi:hypothetical protein N8Z09_02700 [Methylophilaceae bacterium]|nr:hypothetical protein [Methylophilaceae bacterium]